MSDRNVREATTDAGIPVRETYTAADVASGLADRLGAPGEPPFTRGPYPSMYRGQLWTMRQFAGFGSPEEANERFRFLLERQADSGRRVRMPVEQRFGRGRRGLQQQHRAFDHVA